MTFGYPAAEADVLVARSAGRVVITPGGGVSEASAPEILRRTAGAPGQPLAARLSAIMAASRDVST